MKISALKKMVREAVRAELKQMESRLEQKFEEKLNEALSGPELPQLAEQTEEPQSDLADLRARFRSQLSIDEGAEYEGLGATPAADPTAVKPRKTGGPKPENKRGLTKDGDHFASGDGVLEWFKQEKGNAALNEHEQTLRRMEKTDEYVEKIIGKKRI